MTHPTDPNDPGRPHPPRPPAPAPPGPPPPQPRQATGPYPRPPQPPPQSRPGAAPGPWIPKEKGIIGALFDLNFNHLVTPKLIKLWYLVAILLVSLQCTVFLALGLWIGSWDDFYAWGWIMALSSPLIWLFEVLLVRIFMEAVVVRFKTAEHLRVIKDKI